MTSVNVDESIMRLSGDGTYVRWLGVSHLQVMIKHFCTIVDVQCTHTTISHYAAVAMTIEIMHVCCEFGVQSRLMQRIFKLRSNK